MNRHILHVLLMLGLLAPVTPVYPQSPVTKDTVKKVFACLGGLVTLTGLLVALGIYDLIKNPLHYAENPEEANALMNKGYKPNGKNLLGFTPEQAADLSGKLEVAAAIRNNHGYDVPVVCQEKVPLSPEVAQALGVPCNASDYKILGFGWFDSWFASQKKIKEKYLALSRLYHPDKGGDAAKFQAICAAYKRLMA